ncbi:hypothetical protein C8R43DRAFT_943621 [Mycena crocata]|nr:hypothetical protein C8R43DRAFT_943610 [Mycena crocata]KAJ7173981.1 hypothetical protein C8R43DRAFT_943615 [Mycena crocata]KAJ7173986.1 hypothetical protein C8R43DRAFT_943621 [Mycena crocata]
MTFRNTTCLLIAAVVLLLTVRLGVLATAVHSYPNPQLDLKVRHVKCNIADIADVPLHVIGFELSKPRCRSKDTFLNNYRASVHGQRCIAPPRKFYLIFGSPANKVPRPSYHLQAPGLHQLRARRRHTAPPQAFRFNLGVPVNRFNVSRLLVTRPRSSLRRVLRAADSCQNVQLEGGIGVELSGISLYAGQYPSLLSLYPTLSFSLPYTRTR